MRVVPVLDLVDVDVAGLRAQVVDPKLMGGSIGPKWRTLTKVELRGRHGEEWVYWMWEPQSTEGRFDCGYSGMNADFARVSGRSLTIDDEQGGTAAG